MSGCRYRPALERKMARIRVRFSINRGRHGAPLLKLGRIADQSEKFLRSLAADCEIPTKAGEWLALKFKNGSIEYDAELPNDVDFARARDFSARLEALVDYDPDGKVLDTADLPAYSDVSVQPRR
jgi:hypothetical protein